jgi:ADP-glucose pyrophosphorylase
VRVAEGAAVAESVLLPGAVIGTNSRLRGVIVDAGYHVPAGTVVERDAASVGPLVLSIHGSRDESAQLTSRTAETAYGTPPRRGAQFPQYREQPP